MQNYINNYRKISNPRCILADNNAIAVPVSYGPNSSIGLDCPLSTKSVDALWARQQYADSHSIRVDKTTRESGVDAYANTPKRRKQQQQMFLFMTNFQVYN